MMKIPDLYHRLHRAPIVTCRGTGGSMQATKELINVSYEVTHGYELLVHSERKFKLDYVKREIEWYVRGNRWDDSILKHAKIWADCIGKDGGINSNYGQYLFGPKQQLVRVVRELQRDRNSRRAVAMILGQHELHWSSVDQPCTTSIQFLIRDERLSLIVTMRSQDAIFGLGNDVPAFMFIGKVVALALGVRLDKLYMNVGSLHVYKRHFDMVDRICSEPSAWHLAGLLPDLSSIDAINLMTWNYISAESDLRRWLNESI